MDLSQSPPQLCPPASYLIVGAGVFGASTALHLKRANPSATVTLLDRADFPNPTSASSDINKIIRADYKDLFYMVLGLEALEAWRNDPLYSPHFHETGMLFAENVGKGPAILENFKQLGVDQGARLMSVADVCSQFPGLQGANWTDVEQAYFNPSSGWGDAEPALRDVIQAAIDYGVIFKKTIVDRLVLDADGSCLGVCVKDSGVLQADHVILCTGAGTARLLADSAPNNLAFQVNDRLVAAAAVSCTVQVPEDERIKFENHPVLANLMYHTKGEAIPLTPDGRLKVNYELSFTNLSSHSESGQTISIPPSAVEECIWTQDVPETFKWETRNVLKNTFGLGADCYDFISYRICWDAVTPNQDWIISPHPECKNLYIATGGSFHAWKFLPVLGKYIVQMLDGALDSDRAARWGWNRAAEGAVCDSYIPHRDLKDIMALEQERSKV